MHCQCEQNDKENLKTLQLLSRCPVSLCIHKNNEESKVFKVLHCWRNFIWKTWGNFESPFLSCCYHKNIINFVSVICALSSFPVHLNTITQLLTCYDRNHRLLSAFNTTWSRHFYNLIKSKQFCLDWIQGFLFQWSVKFDDQKTKMPISHVTWNLLQFSHQAHKQRFLNKKRVSFTALCEVI